MVLSIFFFKFLILFILIVNKIKLTLYLVNFPLNLIFIYFFKYPFGIIKLGMSLILKYLFIGIDFFVNYLLIISSSLLLIIATERNEFLGLNFCLFFILSNKSFTFNLLLLKPKSFMNTIFSFF